jgi:16S rRNA (uracil1498-N3)-methyltransferase
VSPPAGPDRRVPFAFVDDVDGPVLDPADRHHLERVRRLRAGDGLSVGDGRGRYRRVAFGPTLTPLESVVAVAAPSRPVTVAFALTKGDRPETVVQKLTELGVDRIVPFVASRTVVRWDETKADRNAVRLRVVAREAAAQAHRPWLPVVLDVTTFAAVVTEPGLALAEPGGAAVTATTLAVAVGPEGGWAPEELAAAPATVDLGPTVLRAETAALAAGAFLTALRDGRILGTEGG